MIITLGQLRRKETGSTLTKRRLAYWLILLAPDTRPPDGVHESQPGRMPRSCPFGELTKVRLAQILDESPADTKPPAFQLSPAVFRQRYGFGITPRLPQVIDPNERIYGLGAT
jgi:hypothetical protein